MSALGQKQTFREVNVMSALPPIAIIKPAKADIAPRYRATVLPENGHRQDRGAVRQPMTVASIVLALPTLRQAPLDHWQTYGIT